MEGDITSLPVRRRVICSVCFRFWVLALFFLLTSDPGFGPLIIMISCHAKRSLLAIWSSALPSLVKLRNRIRRKFQPGTRSENNELRRDGSKPYTPSQAIISPPPALHFASAPPIVKLVPRCHYVVPAGRSGCVRVQEKEMVLPHSGRGA